ncbi:MAG: hypothetical protein K6E78_02145 [Treponema sp.]|nr:hypothetical protein [Treponema sp.]
MKRLLTILSLLTLSFTAFSLPGFTPFIQDTPGSYVWYQDFTFQRESYVGFLTFDQSTYQARYYAPQNAKAKLPEKDIKIYFSLNPESDHIELTGERVMAGASQEDTEIVNYLHDMIYELNARRIKAGDIFAQTESGSSEMASSGDSKVASKLTTQATTEDFLNSGKCVRDNFPQFGGDVNIIYDFLVPLFNVKSIQGPEGKTELGILTCGRIQDSQDSSFDSFTGFPEKFPSKKHGFKLSKKAESLTFTSQDGQTIALDSNWSQSMENLWLLGDAALISAGLISKSNVAQKGDFSEEKAIAFILRQLTFSSSSSYTDWRKVEIQNYNLLLNGGLKAADSFKISANIWQKESQNLTKSVKIITAKNGGYAFFTFTVFQNIYQKNQKYFDSILKSYKAE